MAAEKRFGQSSVWFQRGIKLSASAAVAGKKEGEGPLKDSFDVIEQDEYFGQKTWEQAESQLQKICIQTLLDKASLTQFDVDLLLSGDLLNQCTGSAFAAGEAAKAYFGLFGACSTMAESLLLAAMLVDGGYVGRAMALTSSHFCSAERQFRFPLEYGAQRTPTSQWTVTGSGAFLVEEGYGSEGVYITRGHIGKPLDMGINDANNMGAAMAPAASQTICAFLKDTAQKPTDYDLIMTGDLGYEGSRILKELAKEEGFVLDPVHNDGGLMVYRLKEQDVHAGGSGCGCSAIVLAGDIMRRMKNRELKRVLFVGTGALMSPTTVQQNQPIVGIAHLVELEVR